MKELKNLYETPEVEEIVFASLDAIALSDTGTYDPDHKVEDETVGGNWGDNEFPG